MDIALKLKEIAKGKGISIRQLCIKIEMTESGLTRALKRESLTVKTLDKICKVLKVDVSVFFYDSEILVSKFTDDELFLITSTLTKNQIPNELVKKIWDFNKR